MAFTKKHDQKVLFIFIATRACRVIKTAWERQISFVPLHTVSTGIFPNAMLIASVVGDPAGIGFFESVLCESKTISVDTGVGPLLDVPGIGGGNMHASPNCGWEAHQPHPCRRTGERINYRCPSIAIKAWKLCTIEL